MTLPLLPDELLTTTRSVRRRLDLGRPVEREVIEECLRIAQQAPTSSNRQNWHFVVVVDAAKRAALAGLYRQGARLYTGALRADNPGKDQMGRLLRSFAYLANHLHEVPVHVIPCIYGRTDGLPVVAQSGLWGTIAPATWSFMLAARARGLGTTWTSLHLYFEAEAAEILGIPFGDVMQAALIPVAYYTGGTFKPAKRAPLSGMVHWDGW